MPRIYFCTRVHRRFIIKYFGSARNFVLWTVAVILTVYLLDSFLFGTVDESNEVRGSIAKDPQSVLPPAVAAASSSAAASVAMHQQQHLKDQVNVVTVRQPVPISDSSSSRSGSGSRSVCNGQSACPDGQYSYYIKTGLDTEGPPTICFNGETVISPEKKNGKRGISIAIVNENSAQIMETRTFDTYEEDKVFQRYFRLGMENNPVILLATADDASAHLSDESRKILELFGSTLISKLAFRDSFVMVGQLGLETPTKAIEKLNVKTEVQAFADLAEMQGCVAVPMGAVRQVGKLISNMTLNPGTVQFGAELTNCEMTERCPEDSVPVLLGSGRENNEGPKICFNNRLLIGSGDKLQFLGRGFNVLTVDPATWNVLNFARFDTYETEKGSIELVAHLKAVKPEYIVLFITHDDAQTSLTNDAKKMIESFGSSYISTLAFRDVWLLAGQNGIKSVSAIEEIEFGGTDTWPVPIYKKFCLPKILKTLDKKQDPDLKKNSPNRVFCRKYDGYEELCAPGRIDEVITAAPFTDDSMKDNPIFKVPIVVVPGLGHVSTYKQLEALFSIPGIDISLITVVYDQKFQESGALADRFNIPKLQLTSSTKYVFLIEKALEEIWKKFPDREYVILLEEEVIPSKDFLHFMSQCLPEISTDESLIGISAWNENGFTNSSGRLDMVHRGRTMPGLGLLLKKSFYIQYLQGKMSSCCLKRSWYGWFGDDAALDGKEMVYPDVSRVMRRSFMGLTENPDLINAYFNRPRLTSTGEMTKLSGVSSLRSDTSFDDYIIKVVRDSVAVDTVNSNDCLTGRGLGFSIPTEISEKAFTIYYKQTDERDGSILSQLCRCFGLFSASGYRLRGVHKAMLRFTFNGNVVLFVGSTSPYYVNKPDTIKPVQTFIAL